MQQRKCFTLICDFKQNKQSDLSSDAVALRSHLFSLANANKQNGNDADNQWKIVHSFRVCAKIKTAENPSGNKTCDISIEINEAAFCRSSAVECLLSARFDERAP